MKNQLYKFTTKWYGDIPTETDLCSFSLKAVYAVIKFALIVSLVLQPLVFGPLAVYLKVCNADIGILYSVYLVINVGACIIFAFCALTYVCTEWIPNTARSIIYDITCSKKITFEEDD